MEKPFLVIDRTVERRHASAIPSLPKSNLQIYFSRLYTFYARANKVRFSLAVFNFCQILRLNCSSFVLKSEACRPFRNA